MIPVKQTTNRDSGELRVGKVSEKIRGGNAAVAVETHEVNIKKSSPNILSTTNIQLHFYTTQTSPTDTIAYTKLNRTRNVFQCSR
jgi:hypothetical protein